MLAILSSYIYCYVPIYPPQAQFTPIVLVKIFTTATLKSVPAGMGNYRVTLYIATGTQAAYDLSNDVFREFRDNGVRIRPWTPLPDHWLHAHVQPSLVV